MTTILITGIGGRLAQSVAKTLLEEGHEVVGVDYRAPRDPLPGALHFYRANYNKTRIEDIMRKHQPTQVLHLGRVGNLKKQFNKRFDLNVMGSAKIMEQCIKHGVKRLVVLSTFHIYGAHPHNHIPIHEDEPLRAGQTFPELADAVQLDSQASMWVYRHRKLRTVVLRPTNMIGPNLRNAISEYLRQPQIIYLPGFSPMWQFVHEKDMAEAILLALKGDEVGVFNVAGAGTMPILEAFRLTGAQMIPVPGILASLALKAAHYVMPAFPHYLLDFLRYPCVISDDKFRQAFGYQPKVALEESIHDTVRRRGSP